MDDIWDSRQPQTARKNLHVYVSALRKLVGDRIQGVEYGYSLTVAVDELDVLSFGALADSARKAVRLAELDQARALFGEALSLWRDRPLVELRANSSIAAESDVLTDRYLDVYQAWIARLQARAAGGAIPP